VRYLGATLITKKLSYDDCKPLISKLPVLTPRWASKGLFCLKIQLVSSKMLSMQNYWFPFLSSHPKSSEVEQRCYAFLRVKKVFGCRGKSHGKVVDWVERSVALSLFLSRWIGLFLDRMYGVTFCGVSL